ncbi:DUF2513 domain-containing protein [Streptococcus infantarius subsp. infantarius]|uniref:DUF2513 domain-containing protein n=1 Tax=Streptococcus infantarius TaxID=102684 RepID=UPI001BD9B42D|nr:DUF2513 domain-containing protein [Streptococcus infantarius subsp. infantarius]MBT0899910.1 DUF2513 domain-containing protein [Streptococcus infantarius subsp. infantarius]MBT1033549.1 DUF2513 domain-containing protein [Streptococcus infantarius subsp. infantarius]
MKLNYDCIRDILLTIEEIPNRKDDLILENFKSYKKLSKYNEDEIQYNALKLLQEEYVTGLKIPDKNTTIVLFLTDLTWSGHALLNDIRSETVFNQTKEKIIKSVGSASLTIFQQLASTIVLKTLGL